MRAYICVCINTLYVTLSVHTVYASYSPLSVPTYGTSDIQLLLAFSTVRYPSREVRTYIDWNGMLNVHLHILRSM